MHSRIDLQEKLVELLGCGNVYYQPPDKLTMNYPAIRYSKRKPKKKHANNSVYMRTNCYEIIVISKRADDPVITKLEEMPMCEWERNYTADNLNHDVFTLYY